MAECKTSSPTFSSASMPSVADLEKLYDLNVLGAQLNASTLQSSNEGSLRRSDSSKRSNSSSFDESDGSESWAKPQEEQGCNPRKRNHENEPGELNWVWSCWLKQFFSLDASVELCYRCRINNNHHYQQVRFPCFNSNFLQRHRCVRSMCRICRKLEESSRIRKALKHQSELQRKREQSQKFIFEQARLQALEDLKATCNSENKSDLKFGDLFTEEENCLAESRVQGYMQAICT